MDPGLGLRHVWLLIPEQRHLGWNHSSATYRKDSVTWARHPAFLGFSASSVNFNSGSTSPPGVIYIVDLTHIECSELCLKHTEGLAAVFILFSEERRSATRLLLPYHHHLRNAAPTSGKRLEETPLWCYRNSNLAFLSLLKFLSTMTGTDLIELNSLKFY